MLSIAPVIQGDYFDLTDEDVERYYAEHPDLLKAQARKTGNISGLDDEQTAQKFQPAIELVYESAFEEAV